MTINEYLKKTLEYCHGIQRPRPRVVCADGYSVSVQAGSHIYSNPQKNGADYYSKVELGFPSEEDPLINMYAEDDSDYTDTVYGFVPVEVVDKLMEKHGGIVN